MKTNLLITTNSQKVLSLFLEHPYGEYINMDIRKAIKISRSGINYALRDLTKAGYLLRRAKGNTHFYSLQRKHPVIKQLKALKNVHSLLPLIDRLKELSSTIILYGSSARGEDNEDSDIDLFLISHSKKEIADIINQFKSKRKIQFTVKTTLNYDEMKKTDPYFYSEINSGIVLWEVSSEERV